MNESAYIKIPKQLFSICLTTASILAVALMNLGTVQAGASQPQPPGTTFTWGSVEAETGRYNNTGGISYDGRYLMFVSTSPLLVVGDTNNVQDVFVKDLQTGDVQRVSFNTDGSQATVDSSYPIMSPSGRYVAYQRVVSGVIEGYVYDRNTGTTTLASSTANGTSASSNTWPVSISDNGKVLLVVGSSTTNLVSGFDVNQNNVLIKDLGDGSVVQLPFADPIGNGDSWTNINGLAGGKISADGSTVVVTAFDSTTNYRTSSSNIPIAQVVATHLSNGTTALVTPSVLPQPFWANYSFDVRAISRAGNWIVFGTNVTTLLPNSNHAQLYAKNMQSGSITPIDQVPGGGNPNGTDYVDGVAISDDGRYVGFASNATNLGTNYSPTYANAYASLYVSDTVNNTTNMVANQIALNGFYAPGANRIAFTSRDSIDNADPDSVDVYLAQR